jgi:hypothetical protein
MAELIWDGKYDEHGQKRAPVRIELPFQTVETVNESVQERQRTLELSSSGHAVATEYGLRVGRPFADNAPYDATVERGGVFLRVHVMSTTFLRKSTELNLRQQGHTVRNSVDCLIATFCLQGRHSLLHRDRDFDPFEKVLGLSVVHAL